MSKMFIVLIVIGIICISPLILMALWNALMPVIFLLPKINFWQAFGLWILSWLLFRDVPYSNKN